MLGWFLQDRGRELREGGEWALPISSFQFSGSGGFQGHPSLVVESGGMVNVTEEAEPLNKGPFDIPGPKFQSDSLAKKFVKSPIEHQGYDFGSAFSILHG